jgi:cytochrome c oxidase assembly factor CtaG
MTDGERWAALAGVLVVAGLGAAYGRGVQEIWQRRGTGAVVPRRRAVAFGAGLLTILAAQLGPIHEAAERSLAGHMGQHMILLLVGGPLLAAGGAALPLTVAAPRRVRRLSARLRASAPGRWARRPINVALVAAAVHSLVLWFWHLPSPYGWAEANPGVHGAEHLSLVGASWLLWSMVLGPGAARLSPPVSFLLLFATGMPAAALGAVLTLAPAVLYPGHTLADQQLAGLVMWVPMDVVMGVVAVTLFLKWITSLDRRTPAGRDLRPLDSRGETKEAPA